jgi:hypothetical protein
MEVSAMLALQRTLLLLGAAMLAAAVGILDATAAGVWDLAVVFVVIEVVLAIVVVGLRADRQSITIRPDLAAWIRHQAEATGEPVDRLADRAVGAYLTSLGASQAGNRAREDAQ